jgi:hypothetical protein
MSGPKAMEIVRTSLAAARRSNQALVDEWLAGYARAESQALSLNEQLCCLEEPRLPAPTPVAALRLELGKHFAPGEDGMSALMLLRGQKLQLENEVIEREVRLRRSIGDLQRRFRELAERREETEGQVKTLRLWAEKALPSSCPAAARETFRVLLSGSSARLRVPGRVECVLSREAIVQLRDAEALTAECSQAAGEVRRRLKDELENLHRGFLRENIGGTVPAQKLSDYLRDNPLAPVPITGDNKQGTAKLDLLLAEMAMLQDTAGWTGILQKADTIRKESSAERRRGLYESLVLECDSRLRNLREFKSWQTELHQLIDSAAACHSAAIDEVVADLEKMERIGQVRDLSAVSKLLKEAKAATEKQAEREQKRQAILQTLEELGYEVVDGMERGFVSAGKIVMQKPGQSEYAVEVVTNADLSVMQTAMIRYSEGAETTEQQRLRDCEQEEAWCGDHERIRAKLAQQGFATDFRLKIPAGQHPVKMVQPVEGRTSSLQSKRFDRKSAT